MPRILFEENTTLWWVPTIANTNTPTAAEINAGVNLTSFVPKDGIKFGISNNRVSIAAIDSAFDAEIMGSHAAALTVDFFRDDTTDTAWTTLPRRSVGHFVIRLRGTGAATAGQSVMVFPVQTGQRIPNDSAANEKQRFTVETAVHSEPRFTATVA